MTTSQNGLPYFSVDKSDYPAISAFLRISLASIILYRDLLNWYAFHKLPELAVVSWGGLLSPELILVLGAFLFFGFCTRISFFILAIVYRDYNYGLNMMNLGPLFMAPMLMAGALIPTTSALSIDKFLSKTFLFFRAQQNIGQNINFSYALIYLFFLYAINSLCAVYHHLNDPSWSAGITVWKLIQNNFLSRIFLQARQLETTYGPGLIYYFSVLSVVLQTFFQILMWPLAYFKWGRIFVFIHGFLFFLFSLLFLQISVLPYVEIILWIVVFWGDIKLFLKYKKPEATSLSKMYSFSLASILFLLAALAIEDTIKTRYIDNPTIKRAMIRLGIWPPNVFNKADLEMGQSWFNLYQIDSVAGLRIRVPIFFEDGSRDKYHNFDYIYYGQTLRWRRAVIGFDDWSNDKLSSPHLEVIKNVAKFHTNIEGLNPETEYYYEIVRDQSMNMDLPIDKRIQAQIVKTGFLLLSLQ